MKPGSSPHEGTRSAEVFIYVVACYVLRTVTFYSQTSTRAPGHCRGPTLAAGADLRAAVLAGTRRWKKQNRETKRDSPN